MNQWMERAVELALQNIAQGGQPFGAVLVKGDEIIGEGVNELHLRPDSTGHAELLALRRAQEKLGSIDLRGTVMYASGAPCPMCFGAMAMAGVDKAYYANSLADAMAVGLSRSSEVYADLQKINEERVFRMIHMPVEDIAKSPMHVWHSKT
ncbi:nucleoside deaminase [Lysinibacillus sphaericus]|uniref:Guanine deaminase n=4 Tax=Lysinibacillus TaxID=400634 RepID=A0A2S0JW16_LYSSH|nr:MULTISPECIES: nucleoside deaminase [Lysinibacillus]AHN23605.1 guanine deaminase [Lysinibacillus varians]AVK95154.1 tRNA-specific adenosine deaminase [Lysinibacillus sphaericus]MCS1381751.1 nucleoside deaminase [Lysinibacillus sphaericus]MED4544771.1 nucleoside deaminase [Lysinibacillus sphaericus]TKI18212.1 nucleoside deaminase [Lysinibacillus sphaericus]